MLFLRTCQMSLLAVAFAACVAACSSQSGSAASSVGGAGGSVGCASAGADTYLAGMKKAGTMGLFSFELVSSTPAPPALNDNTFVVRVADSDGNPATGELSVALDMPQHGHPSPAQPTISFDPDTASYTLAPMRLFMVGLWRITFGFRPAGTKVGDAQSDSAVFSFCID